MYFTGSPFESAGLAAGAAVVSTGLDAPSAETEFVGLAGPFFAAAIRTAKASGKEERNAQCGAQPIGLGDDLHSQ